MNDRRIGRICRLFFTPKPREVDRSSLTNGDTWLPREDTLFVFRLAFLHLITGGSAGE